MTERIRFGENCMEFVIDKEDKILIVAPHPDDESIGCGGLLALYGKQCDVRLLTDGRRGKSEQRKNVSDNEIIATRKEELRIDDFSTCVAA